MEPILTALAGLGIIMCLAALFCLVPGSSSFFDWLSRPTRREQHLREVAEDYRKSWSKQAVWSPNARADPRFMATMQQAHHSFEQALARYPDPADVYLAVALWEAEMLREGWEFGEAPDEGQSFILRKGTIEIEYNYTAPD